MILKRLILFLITISIIAVFCAKLYAQLITLQKKRFSVLGDKKKAALTISTSTAKTAETAAPAPTAPKQPEKIEAPSYITAPEKAGEEFLKFLEQKKVIYYSKERWMKMQKMKEEGIAPGEEDRVVISTAPRPAPAPLPPGLAVELPYESQLSISGRKTIGVAFKSTIYADPDDQKRKNSTSFDMNQELQVRIKGRVGRKINVNVDFDDTSADKRDISVVYKGDPDEVVQEAAFGDISMSLPSTEFVGYSRQLFGVKLHTKYKGLKSWGFFSRTKGESEVKRFTGNTQLVRKTIADNAFIQLKYYLLSFNNDKIKEGTAKIYIDDRNPNNNNVNTSTNTFVETALDDLTVSSTTFPSGDFDLLVAGQDYTIDYDNGIIIFRNRLKSNCVVAVDYQRQADGTWLSDDTGNWKIIKDERNTIGITRELKTFYNLGNVKIIRDNDRGNFILKIQDLNKDEPSSIEWQVGGSTQTKVVPKYSNTSESNIIVDFESGVFYFDPPQGKPFHDTLYTAERKHLYNIFVEYRYRVKIISLQRFGIVPQSERVTMDGTVLQRDVDYFIDYDAGIVTLFNEEKITENTIIEIAYDYAPFGTAGGSTLVGTRSELSLTKNLFFGGSFIYDFAAKTLTTPDIRTTPSSLMVWEVDSRMQDLKIPYTPLKVNVSGEYAASKYNPNSMNKAIVESMEGIKQEDGASLYDESWHPAKNPSGGGRYYKEDIVWDSGEVAKTDIFSSQDIDTEEKQQVLDIDYNLSRSSQVSIVQSFSNVGMDYSKKLFLEAWIKGNDTDEELLISYGSFHEDADSDNVLDTEDNNPKDGILTGDEDNGWVFNNLGDTTTVRINIEDKIDTEDLDNDGVLDTIDLPASPCPYILNSDNYTSKNSKGWKYYKIPLNISNKEDWKAIKQLRLTIKGSNKQAGRITIGKLSLISNKWEYSGTTVLGSTLAIAGINNEDNSDYISLVHNPDYQSLYDIKDTDSKNIREQALSLKYTVIYSTAELAAKMLFGRPFDFSNYKEFKFFVYGKGAGAAGDVFFMQMGNDKNYYEYSIPFPASWDDSWNLVTIIQKDINNDNKPDMWAVNDVRASTRTVGAPNFNNISQLKVGVRPVSTTGIGNYREIWINEIHVIDSWKKAGDAWRANADLKWPGWMSVSAKRKEVDRNFQTFSAGVYNRDYLEDSGNFTFDRIRFLPIKTSLTRTRTVTPSVVQTQGNLVSVLEEGRVISYSGSTSANPNLQMFFSPVSRFLPLLRRFIPNVGGSYTRAITDTHQIERLEDKETFRSNADYPFPFKLGTFLPFRTSLNVFPSKISGNYSLSNSFYRVYPSTKMVDSDNFLALDTLQEYLDYFNRDDIKPYNTLQISEAWSINSPFQFWRNFNFNPGYSLTKVREKNKAFDPEHEEYPKSANQKITASSNIRLFPWLNPRFSYNISTNENYDLTMSTVAPFKYPSERKDIERRSDFDVSWNFQVRDVFKFRYTESLGFTASYKQHDSDLYEKVESSYAIIGVFDHKSLKIRDNYLKSLEGGSTEHYRVKSIIKKDDIRLSGKYNPFEAFSLPGRISPFNTLSTNFTYNGSIEDSYITGTKKFVQTELWPDLSISMNKWENMFWLEKWLSNSSANFRHNKKVTLTRDVTESKNLSYGTDLRFLLLKKYDLNFGFNLSTNQDYDIAKSTITKKGRNMSLSGQTGFNLKTWRFTVRYEYGNNWQKDGTGKHTQKTKTHSATVQSNADMSFPHGLPLPFTRKTLPLKNRLVFNSTFKFVTKIDVDKRNNTDNYSLKSNADYEVSQNFRAALGLGYSYMHYRDKESDDAENKDFHVIDASFRLTIQF